MIPNSQQRKMLMKRKKQKQRGGKSLSNFRVSSSTPSIPDFTEVFERISEKLHMNTMLILKVIVLKC